MTFSYSRPRAVVLLAAALCPGAVGAFAPLLNFDPADGALLLAGIAIFRACPAHVAAGLLPLAVLLAPGSQVPARLSAGAAALVAPASASRLFWQSPQWCSLGSDPASGSCCGCRAPCLQPLALAA